MSEESLIRLVVDQIDNACDLKDWDRTRSYFDDIVDVDFSSLGGGEPTKISGDDLVGAWKANLYEGKKTYHQRGNHVIEVDDQRATVFSKAYAFNLIESGPVTGLWEVWGIYTHTLKNIDGEWKVSGMTLDVIHQRGDERVRTYVPG